jgi:hypothetical protein
LFKLEGFFFIGFCHPRPFLGPKLGIFAVEIRDHRFHVIAFGESKDITLAGALANHRFDFIEIFCSPHDCLPEKRSNRFRSCWTVVYSTLTLTSSRK